MKVYLAALTQTGYVWRGSSRAEGVHDSEDARIAYPYDLESYHYIRETADAADYFREMKKTVFMDSGAFSMFSVGATVDLGAYADFINDNKDWIHIASNVDEIGANKEAESYDNQKTLERLIKPPKGVPLDQYLCPVHHARDDDKWLRKYIAEGYPYIFLGGMVAESTAYLRGWLDHVWDKYLTHKDGTSKLKIHGFGMTTLELMERYPWYSVDSSSWVQVSRFGGILLDLPGRDVKINVSEKSSSIHDLGKHYDNLTPPDRRVVEARIRELGYDPEQLRLRYGMRDRFNIEFYHRMCSRVDPTFRKRQIGVFD